MIGCGAAGLAAGRHLVAEQMEVVIYEQTAQLGGTWVFTEQTGLDQYGLPIHSSMYRSLRTNLPKEIMGFPDFPIPELPHEDRSYLKASEILAFLDSYAHHFNILPHVKFLHHVKLVEPIEDEGKVRWSVTVADLPRHQDSTSVFDAVIVCNGHYHTPLYPETKGLDTFGGEKYHSHDYREPDLFAAKRVLVIGAGPSGIDLSNEIAQAASKVVLSRHRYGDDIKNVFPDNVVMKYEISEIKGNKILFEDGTEEEVDIIFFCTGYKYSFPFLSEKCEIRVVENCVQPLYKHFIHTKYPSLCLVGLPYYVCAFSLFDLQVRFFVKTLQGEVLLPSKEEMERDTEREMEMRRERGLKKKQFHMMGEMQGDYYRQLAEQADLQPLPPVFASLHNYSSQRQIDNLVSFRDDVYKLIDSKTFLKVK